MKDLTVNSLLSPHGGLFISSPFEGEGLIYFRKNDGISSPLRTRIQSGKAQVQDVLGHAPEDQNRSSSW